MNRRSVVKGMHGIGAASRFRLPLSNPANWNGKLFVFIQADGGWDPTSLCDPKTNTKGEPVINHWAEKGEIRQAGNIRYAPFGQNRAFFEKHCQRMLVANEADAQTDSHPAGIVRNWSGRDSEGHPTTMALLAAHNSAGHSMPYLSFGRFSNTAGVAVFTRLDYPDEIRNVARPEMDRGDRGRQSHFS